MRDGSSLTAFDSVLASWAREMAPSPLEVALAASSRANIIPLSLGLPDPSLFPIEELRTSMMNAFMDPERALQYRLPSAELREHVCIHMRRRGVCCKPENVLLTAGAQQALSILAQLFIDPSRAVIDIDLSYPAFRQSIAPYRPQMKIVSHNPASGVDLDSVEQVLRTLKRQAAFIYMVADGHNPLGVSLDVAARDRLACLARRYEVPIVEDDPYGCLRYDDKEVPAIRAFEPEWILYVGSFSKILAPALRMGWIVGPESLIGKCASIKEGLDINTGTLAQATVCEYLRSGRLAAHIDDLRRVYREKRDAMMNALSAAFPSVCRWWRPSTGVFVWIELPERLNATDILQCAINDGGVSFVPCEGFSHSARRNGMRLSFSRCKPEAITEGVTRLGSILQALC